MPSCRSASSRSRSAADAIAICQCMPWRPSRWRTQPAAAWRMDGATATTGSGNSLAFRARLLLLLLQSGRRRARCRQAGRGRVNEIALTAHADGCDLLGWEGNRMAFCGDCLFLAFGMCCATNLLLLFSCPVPQISFPPLRERDFHHLPWTPCHAMHCAVLPWPAALPMPGAPPQGRAAGRPGTHACCSGSKRHSQKTQLALLSALALWHCAFNAAVSN